MWKIDKYTYLKKISHYLSKCIACTDSRVSNIIRVSISISSPVPCWIQIACGRIWGVSAAAVGVGIVVIAIGSVGVSVTFCKKIFCFFLFFFWQVSPINRKQQHHQLFQKLVELMKTKSEKPNLKRRLRSKFHFMQMHFCKNILTLKHWRKISSLKLVDESSDERWKIGGINKGTRLNCLDNVLQKLRNWKLAVVKRASICWLWCKCGQDG